MSNQPNHSGIRDNHRRGIVTDFLKARIQTGFRPCMVITGRQEQAGEATDFELIAWLMIKAEG